MTWWQYVVVLEDDIDREKVCNDLQTIYGIPTGNAYWPPCHNQPAFKQYINGAKYPVADDLLKRHISLPLYVEMDLEQVDYVADAINKVI